MNDRPVFVFDGGDLSVYPTDTAAASGSEIYDVSVLSCFSDDGTVLRASVEGYQVRLTPTSERRPDELRERLRAYLAHRTVGFDPALADDPVSAGRALLEAAGEARSPKWTPWLDRRVHRATPAVWPPEPRGTWAWGYALLTWPLAVLLFGGAFSLSGPNLYNLYRLQSAGAQTQGVVTGFDENNHEACKYTFILDGRHYRGSGDGGCSGVERLDTFVRVTYLPSDPSVSADGSTIAELWEGSLITFALPTLCAIGAASPKGWRRPGRRR